MPDERGVPGGPEFVPVLATMKIIMFQDGNWSYEAPTGNLPVCFSMIGMMTAELAALQAERTRKEGGQIHLPGDSGLIGPRG